MTTTVRNLERLPGHTQSTIRDPKELLKGIPADPNERGGIDGETSAGRIRPKWAWHYSVLLKLRERLLKALSERLVGVAESLEPHSMTLADVATDEFDHTFATGELSAEQDALYEVDRCTDCHGLYFDAGEFEDLAHHTVADFFRDLMVQERR